MKKSNLLMLAGLFTACIASAQPDKLENYRHLLTLKENSKGYKRDTSYINLLAKFSTSFYELNPDSMLWYAGKVCDYSRSIQYEKGEADGLSAMGYYYCLKGDYTQMLSCYQQSLALAEKVHYRQLTADMIRNIGQFYMNTDRETEAKEMFEKAYRIEEELGDNVGKAYLLVDIAGIYLLRHDNEKALSLYRAALKVQKDSNSYTAAFIRVDIGNVLSEKGQYKDALACFGTSLKYYRDTHNELGRMNTLGSIANTCRHMGQTDTAIALATESFLLAKEIKNQEGVTNASECLASLYETKGDYRKSLVYLKLFKAYSDSLFNEDTRRKTTELQAKFKYEQKEALLKEAHLGQVRMLELEVGIALLSALLLAGITLFFLAPKWLRRLPRFQDPDKKDAAYEERRLTYL